MALVKQPKTAGFKPISKYEYIVPRLSRCQKNTQFQDGHFL